MGKALDLRGAGLATAGEFALLSPPPSSFSRVRVVCADWGALWRVLGGVRYRRLTVSVRRRGGRVLVVAEVVLGG